MKDNSLMPKIKIDPTMKEGEWRLEQMKDNATPKDNDIFEITHKINEDALTIVQLCQKIDRNQETIKALLEAAKLNANRDCDFDRLNPCWNNRPTDIIGKHWGIGTACGACTAKAVLAQSEKDLSDAK